MSSYLHFIKSAFLDSGGPSVLAPLEDRRAIVVRDDHIRGGDHPDISALTRLLGRIILVGLERKLRCRGKCDRIVM